MAHLRLSSRAVRSSWATVGLVDCDTGRVIEIFATLADAARAKMFLEQVGIVSYGRNFGGAVIHDAAASACERLHGRRQYEQLPLRDLIRLITTVRCSLEGNPE